VAADVCRVLDIVNVKQSIEGLSDQHTQLIKKSNLCQAYVSFPNRGATCISEGQSGWLHRQIPLGLIKREINISHYTGTNSILIKSISK